MSFICTVRRIAYFFCPRDRSEWWPSSILSIEVEEGGRGSGGGGGGGGGGGTNSKTEAKENQNQSVNGIS